jgi:hypothetical protein
MSQHTRKLHTRLSEEEEEERKKAGVDMGLFLIPHIPLPSSPPLSFPFLC